MLFPITKVPELFLRNVFTNKVPGVHIVEGRCTACRSFYATLCTDLCLRVTSKIKIVSHIFTNEQSLEQSNRVVINCQAASRCNVTRWHLISDTRENKNLLDRLAAIPLLCDKSDTRQQNWKALIALSALQERVSTTLSSLPPDTNNTYLFVAD